MRAIAGIAQRPSLLQAPSATSDAKVRALVNARCCSRCCWLAIWRGESRISTIRRSGGSRAIVMIPIDQMHPAVQRIILFASLLLMAPKSFGPSLCPSDLVSPSYRGQRGSLHVVVILECSVPFSSLGADAHAPIDRCPGTCSCFVSRGLVTTRWLGMHDGVFQEFCRDWNF